MGGGYKICVSFLMVSCFVYSIVCPLKWCQPNDARAVRDISEKPVVWNMDMKNVGIYLKQQQKTTHLVCHLDVNHNKLL